MGAEVNLFFSSAKDPSASEVQRNGLTGEVSVVRGAAMRLVFLMRGGSNDAGRQRVVDVLLHSCSFWLGDVVYMAAGKGGSRQ